METAAAGLVGLVTCCSETGQQNQWNQFNDVQYFSLVFSLKPKIVVCDGGAEVFESDWFAWIYLALLRLINTDYQ